MKATALRTTICAALLLATGCATFRQGNVPPVERWPLQSAAKKDVRVMITTEFIENGRSLSSTSGATDWLANHVLAVYTESGAFSQVHRGSGSAERLAEVRIKYDAEASMGMAVLSGLTLTLVPSITTTQMIVRTTFKDDEGNELGTITKSETVKTWIQLFMVFAMPTNFPTRVALPTFDDLNRSTLADAQARGWI